MRNPIVLNSDRNERGLEVKDIYKWWPCAYLDLFCSKVKLLYAYLVSGA